MSQATRIPLYCVHQESVEACVLFNGTATALNCWSWHKIALTNAINQSLILNTVQQPSAIWWAQIKLFMYILHLCDTTAYHFAPFLFALKYKSIYIFRYLHLIAAFRQHLLVPHTRWISNSTAWVACCHQRCGCLLTGSYRTKIQNSKSAMYSTDLPYFQCSSVDGVWPCAIVLCKRSGYWPSQKCQRRIM